MNYLRLCSGSIEGFKDKGQNLFNMRCPYCGDSSKDKNKARGYCFKSPKDGLLAFKCHNCGVGASFKTFLKHVDAGLYGQYRFEVFNKRDSENITDIMKINKVDTLKKSINGLPCTKLNELSRIHQSNSYINSRGLNEYKEHFYYAENFKDLVESLGIHQNVPSDSRIVLFETNKFGHITVVIGRAIDSNSKQRYSMIRVDETYPKIYGLGKVDTKKRCHVVEGAFDSLFIDNAIAALGSDLVRPDVESLIPDLVYIHDNEPRNAAIVKKMKNLISSGRKLVIFDNEYKDINIMVNNNIDVNETIKRCTYSGLKALLVFNKWKKI